MAKGNHASFAVIGFTVILGVAAIVGTLIYVGGVGSGKERVYAETYSTKSVSGLSVGSAVNFRGVKVGEVEKISFVGNEYEVEGKVNGWVYIRLGFDRELLSTELEKGVSPEELLRMMVEGTGMCATVTASGITGLSRIELDIRANISPLKLTWTPKTPYIPCAVSLMDSFSDSAVKVMNQINRMDIEAAWSNVSASVEALARSTESVRVVLETRQGDVDKLMGDLRETLGALKDVAAELRANPSALIRERVPRELSETR